MRHDTRQRAVGLHRTEPADSIPPNGQIAPIRRIVQLFRTSSPRLRSKLAKVSSRYLVYKAFIQKRVEDEDHRVRANLLESLWGIDNATAMMVFHSLADDPHPRVRCNALLGQYFAGDYTAAEAMHLQAKHPSPELRVSTAWAMGETKDSRFREDLNELSEDENDVVRQTARLSLEKLPP